MESAANSEWDQDLVSAPFVTSQRAAFLLHFCKLDDLADILRGRYYGYKAIISEFYIA